MLLPQIEKSNQKLPEIPQNKVKNEYNYDEDFESIEQNLEKQENENKIENNKTEFKNENNEYFDNLEKLEENAEKIRVDNPENAKEYTMPHNKIQNNDYNDDFEPISSTQRYEKNSLNSKEITMENDKQTNQSAIFAVFSKPNLRPKRKMPAFCPSHIKSRPSHDCQKKSVNRNKSYFTANKNPLDPELFLKEDLNTTDLDPISKVDNDETPNNYNDINIIKPREIKTRGTIISNKSPFTSNNQNSEEYLLLRIEQALFEAEKLIIDCDEKYFTPLKWRKIEKQNQNLRSQLKILNELLSTLLLHKSNDLYRQKRLVSRLNTRVLISRIDLDKNRKRLILFETEYKKYKARLDQISNPQYPITLKNKCVEMSVKEKVILNRRKQREMKYKLEMYKANKMGAEAEAKRKEKFELIDLINSESNARVLLTKLLKDIARSEEIMKKESEQRKKLKETYKKLLVLSEHYGISPTKRKNNNSIYEKQYYDIEHDLMKIRAENETLQKKMLIKAKDCDNHAKSLENRLKLLKNEILDKNNFIIHQEEMMQELIGVYENIGGNKNEIIQEYFFIRKVLFRWENKILDKNITDELNVQKEIFITKNDEEYEKCQKSEQNEIQKELPKNIEKTINPPEKIEKVPTPQKISEIKEQENTQGGSGTTVHITEKTKETPPKRLFNFKKIEEENKKKQEIAIQSDNVKEEKSEKCDKDNTSQKPTISKENSQISNTNPSSNMPVQIPQKIETPQPLKIQPVKNPPEKIQISQEFQEIPSVGTKPENLQKINSSAKKTDPVSKKIEIHQEIPASTGEEDPLEALFRANPKKSPFKIQKNENNDDNNFLSKLLQKTEETNMKPKEEKAAILEKILAPKKTTVQKKDVFSQLDDL